MTWLLNNSDFRCRIVCFNCVLIYFLINKNIKQFLFVPKWMQSTDITSLEFYRLAAPTLDTHFTLKESAFRCNKALQKSKVERPWQNEIKVEILKLIIMLCNSHPLKELRFLKIHTTNHESQSNSSSFPFLEEFYSY